MIEQSSHESPILVTRAAGAVGSIRPNLTEMLLAKLTGASLGRREDEHAEALSKTPRWP